MSEIVGLRKSALEIFHATRASIDVESVVSDFVALDGNSLKVGNEDLRLDSYGSIIAIGIGKACQAMGRALSNTLGERLSAGLIATSSIVGDVPEGFEVFLGGHPVPTEASIEAASRAIEILKASDSDRTLVLFLITGGGSAVFEKAIDPSITLADLRSLNSTLVGCGAVIGEINTVRRHLSAVKGGRLAEAAPRSRQISLYISDVNDNDLSTVASGPTLPGSASLDDFHRVIEKYSLLSKLPPSVVTLINAGKVHSLPMIDASLKRTHHLLLDNRRALLTAKGIAEQMGFVVEIAEDLVEADVAVLARTHLERILKLKAQYRDRPVCVLSGGEAICPVRGTGQGGRNQEFVLRAMLEPALQDRDDIVVLSAGTDGIDGNSPAAGAFGDHSMLRGADAVGFSPREYLENSDSYTLLKKLGGTIVTGPTGNNVRDLRVVLCS
jgi:glycerate 2-kinase